MPRCLQDNEDDKPLRMPRRSTQAASSSSSYPSASTPSSSSRTSMRDQHVFRLKPRHEEFYPTAPSHSRPEEPLPVNANAIFPPSSPHPINWYASPSPTSRSHGAPTEYGARRQGYHHQQHTTSHLPPAFQPPPPTCSSLALSRSFNPIFALTAWRIFCWS